MVKCKLFEEFEDTVVLLVVDKVIGLVLDVVQINLVIDMVMDSISCMAKLEEVDLLVAS